MKYIILFILSLFSITSFSNCDCNSFKEGEFFYIMGGDTISISRYGNIQTEGIHPYLSESKVIWVDDCQYILRPFYYSNKSNEFLNGDIMVKITKATNDYYIAKVWMKGFDKFIYQIWRKPN